MPVAMRVLVADDDDAVRMALELLLRREKMAVTAVRSPRGLLEALDGETFDVVLLDLNYERDTTSGAEGLSLLERLRKERPTLPVVVMTGWASIDGAVQAMRRGAVDYVPKPWDNARVVELLRRASRPGGRALTGWQPSAAMREVIATIEQVAFSDAPILITGEHGTGKELIARLVHDRSGRRGELVAVNAGALPDGTFESELFGHVRGAFTDAKADRAGAFARASGGTIFLDEIANMPVAQQAKLLRVLQERAFQPVGAGAPVASSARVVSATNVDLDALIAEGRFRADIMYRLNAIHVRLPPLRARREEIASLVSSFVVRDAERYGVPVPAVDEDVLPALEAYDWPGNVRELDHAVQRAVLLSAGSGRIQLVHLGLRSRPVPAPSAVTAVDATAETLHAAEHAALLRALERHPDDRLAAAKSLGLSRSSFYRRVAQHGIRLR